MATMHQDFVLLATGTINAPRARDITGGDLERSIRQAAKKVRAGLTTVNFAQEDEDKIDPMALEQFFTECSINVQLGFLRQQGIPLEMAKEALEWVRPLYPKNFVFALDR